MNNFEDRFNAYIQAHPRRVLQLMLIVLCSIWASVVCVCGLFLYLVSSRFIRIQWWVTLATGIFMVVAILVIDLHYYAPDMNLYQYITDGFHENIESWRVLVTGGAFCAIKYMGQNMLSQVIGF